MPTTPPVTSPETRLAYSDQYGTVWADVQGYLYRGPEYRVRYDQLASLGQGGDWEDMTFAFRTTTPVPAYRNTFLRLARYVAGGADPLIPSPTTAWPIAGILAAGAALAFALKR